MVKISSKTVSRIALSMVVLGLVGVGNALMSGSVDSRLATLISTVGFLGIVTIVMSMNGFKFKNRLDVAIFGVGVGLLKLLTTGTLGRSITGSPVIVGLTPLIDGVFLGGVVVFVVGFIATTVGKPLINA